MAQDVISDFAVEFKVSGDNQAVNQEKGDFLSYAYKGKKMSMVLVNKMVDMHMIYDAEAKKGLLLNSMQGGAAKIASELTEEAMAFENAAIELEPLDGSKRLNGYKCQGAKFQHGKKSIEIWYTTKLKPFDFEFEGYFFNQLDGFPLLMIETSSAGVLTSKATKVTLEVEDNLFDQTIPEGYTKISFEDLNGGK